VIIDVEMSMRFHEPSTNLVAAACEPKGPGLQRCSPMPRQAWSTSHNWSYQLQYRYILDIIKIAVDGGTEIAGVSAFSEAVAYPMMAVQCYKPVERQAHLKCCVVQRTRHRTATRTSDISHSVIHHYFSLRCHQPQEG
jgi:hypothetical protein